MTGFYHHFAQSYGLGCLLNRAISTT